MKMKFSKMFSKVMVVMIAVVVFGGLSGSVKAQTPLCPSGFVYANSQCLGIEIGSAVESLFIAPNEFYNHWSSWILSGHLVQDFASNIAWTIFSIKISTAYVPSLALPTGGIRYRLYTLNGGNRGPVTTRWFSNGESAGTGTINQADCERGGSMIYAHWSQQANYCNEPINAIEIELTDPKPLGLSIKYRTTGDGGVTYSDWVTSGMTSTIGGNTDGISYGVVSGINGFEIQVVTTPVYDPNTPPPSSTFDYSLTNGGNRYITPGSTVTNPINSTLVSGTTAPVRLYVSSIKSSSNVEVFNTANGIGTTSNALSINPVTPTQSSDLTLTATAGVPAGVYTVTVNGIGNSVATTTSYTVTVDPYGLTVGTGDPTVGTGATSCSGGSAIIRWNRLVGATSYTVYRSTGGGAASIIYSSVPQPAPGTNLEKTDSGLIPNTAYTYTIVSNIGSSQPITGFSSVADPALCPGGTPLTGSCTADKTSPVTSGTSVKFTAVPNITNKNSGTSPYTYSWNGVGYVPAFEFTKIINSTSTPTVIIKDSSTPANTVSPICPTITINTPITTPQLWPDARPKPTDAEMMSQPPLKVREGQEVKVNYTWPENLSCKGLILSSPSGWDSSTNAADWLKNKLLNSGLGSFNFTNLSKGTLRIKLTCSDSLGFKESSSIFAKIMNYLFPITQAAPPIESNDVTIIVTKSTIQEF